MNEVKRKGWWWVTLPGLLTAAAGLITAITGMIVAMHQLGVFEKREPPVPSVATQSSSSTISSKPKDAWSYSFDGFKLGSEYKSDIMVREPYTDPCDNDPVSDGFKEWQAMVYGALLCRGRAFPEGTSVVIFLPWEGSTVSAFSWLGGNYFSRRSDFPLRVGQSVDEAINVLGEPLRKIALSGKLLVYEHQGKIYSVSEENRLVGFVFGAISSNPESELWDVIDQMYHDYTVGTNEYR